MRIESVKLEATPASIIMMPKQTSFMTGCTHTGAWLTYCVGAVGISGSLFSIFYTISPRRRKHASDRDDARDRAGCEKEWPLFSAEL